MDGAGQLGETEAAQCQVQSRASPQPRVSGPQFNEFVSTDALGCHGREELTHKRDSKWFLV